MSVTSLDMRPAPRRIGVWTLQAALATAFLTAGAAKLAAFPHMVQLFDQVGLGQWFRVVTGAVEIVGASALLYPRLASIGGLWLGTEMLFAVMIHLFVLHTSPVAALVLALLNGLIVYLRRDEFASFARTFRDQL